MSAEKISKDRLSLKGKTYSRDKFLEFKKTILKSQKDLNLDEDVVNFLSSFCDKIAAGKNISIIEETELWSVAQAAKELGVTRPTIYKMVERGDLGGIDLDGLKIVPSSLVSFMKRREILRQEALKKLHEIDIKLKKETRDLLPETDDENFEELNL